MPDFVTNTQKTAPGSLKQLFFEEAYDKKRGSTITSLDKREGIKNWWNGKKRKPYELVEKIKEKRPTEKLAKAYEIKDLPTREKKIIEIWQNHVSFFAVLKKIIIPAAVVCFDGAHTHTHTHRFAASSRSTSTSC